MCDPLVEGDRRARIGERLGDLDAQQFGERGLLSIEKIAENAGVEGSIVVSRVMADDSASFGFNAQTEEYGDLFAQGVIDPAKVVRTALQDAASVAGLLITTEAAVVEAPKKSAGAGGPGGGGMGGMGDMDF